ncbi:alpha/beta hydrolase [Sphingomonas lacunae]|uniref:Alpha/beta hydrolase n=2 Tax=Sphingomonas lacunae TaxID=2698828 RepID=A0A6M4AYC5_9SPHN|nr:alpha/beta hydrolase [Sphingomonas lacunae]
MAKATHHMINGSGGLKLSVDVSGPVDGQPVLLAHGGGQTKRAWRKTAEVLAEAGYRAIAVDLRGHGQSQWASPDGYDVGHMAADLLAIANTLDRKPAMVGASLGGLSGLVAEGELRPGSFQSLTLVDVTPNMSPAGVDRIVGFMLRHMDDGFATLDEAADAIASYTENRERRSSSEGLSHYLRLGDDGRYRWHWDPAFLGNAQERRGNGLQDDRLELAARSLSLPVHLVRGANSDLVTVEAARAFLDFVPHARFDDIAGAGHMVVGDKNDIFSAVILDFLKGLEAKG